MEKYVKVKPLGKGSFGAAVLIKRRADNQPFVVKEVQLARMSPKERDEARHECKVLQQLQHPNIVQYVEHFEKRNVLYIVMEYADGGDLHQKIKNQRNTRLKEDSIMHYFAQICLAVDYLHSRHILHRDLKTMNVFLTSNGTVKLGDFGISTILRNTMGMAKTQCGTPYYFSPELCRNVPYNNKSDVWALGVILYELATLRHPFDGNSMQQLMQRITKSPYQPISAAYTKSLRDLIQECLEKEHGRRPTVKALLSRPTMMEALLKLDEDLQNANNMGARLQNVVAERQEKEPKKPSAAAEALAKAKQQAAAVPAPAPTTPPPRNAYDRPQALQQPVVAQHDANHNNNPARRPSAQVIDYVNKPGPQPVHRQQQQPPQQRAPYQRAPAAAVMAEEDKKALAQVDDFIKQLDRPMKLVEAEALKEQKRKQEERVRELERARLDALQKRQQDVESARKAAAARVAQQHAQLAKERESKVAELQRVMAQHDNAFHRMGNPQQQGQPKKNAVSPRAENKPGALNKNALDAHNRDNGAKPSGGGQIKHHGAAAAFLQQQQQQEKKPDVPKASPKPQPKKKDIYAWDEPPKKPPLPAAALGKQQNAKDQPPSGKQQPSSGRPSQDQEIVRGADPRRRTPSPQPLEKPAYMQHPHYNHPFEKPPPAPSNLAPVPNAPSDNAYDNRPAVSQQYLKQMQDKEQANKAKNWVEKEQERKKAAMNARRDEERRQVQNVELQVELAKQGGVKHRVVDPELEQWVAKELEKNKGKMQKDAISGGGLSPSANKAGRISGGELRRSAEEADRVLQLHLNERPMPNVNRHGVAQPQYRQPNLNQMQPITPPPRSITPPPSPLRPAPVVRTQADKPLTHSSDGIAPNSARAYPTPPHSGGFPEVNDRRIVTPPTDHPGLWSRRQQMHPDLQQKHHPALLDSSALDSNSLRSRAMQQTKQPRRDFSAPPDLASPGRISPERSESPGTSPAKELESRADLVEVPAVRRSSQGGSLLRRSGSDRPELNVEEASDRHNTTTEDEEGDEYSSDDEGILDEERALADAENADPELDAARRAVEYTAMRSQILEVLSTVRPRSSQINVLQDHDSVTPKRQTIRRDDGDDDGPIEDLDDDSPTPHMVSVRRLDDGGDKGNPRYQSRKGMVQELDENLVSQRNDGDDDEEDNEEFGDAEPLTPGAGLGVIPDDENMFRLAHLCGEHFMGAYPTKMDGMALFERDEKKGHHHHPHRRSAENNEMVGVRRPSIHRRAASDSNVGGSSSSSAANPQMHAEALRMHLEEALDLEGLTRSYRILSDINADGHTGSDPSALGLASPTKYGMEQQAVDHARDVIREALRDRQRSRQVKKLTPILPDALPPGRRGAAEDEEEFSMKLSSTPEDSPASKNNKHQPHQPQHLSGHLLPSHHHRQRSTDTSNTASLRSGAGETETEDDDEIALADDVEQHLAYVCQLIFFDEATNVQ